MLTFFHGPDVGFPDDCRGRCGGSEIPQDAIHALDVALKHGTSLRPECQSFARAFFFYDPSIVRPLGNGAEVSLASPSALTSSILCTIQNLRVSAIVMGFCHELISAGDQALRPVHMGLRAYPAYCNDQSNWQGAPVQGMYSDISFQVHRASTIHLQIAHSMP